jgi:hypothetical protein
LADHEAGKVMRKVTRYRKLSYVIPELHLMGSVVSQYQDPMFYKVASGESDIEKEKEKEIHGNYKEQKGLKSNM